MGIRSRKIASARMVFFILAFVFGVAFFGFKTNQAHAAYQYYRSITVTSTPSIASGTQTSFPMLVSSTLSSWEASSTGGRIQNLCTAPNGGQEPCDLVFATSSANCGTANLNFETESYVSSTGALVDWVNVPSVSMGTVIYSCYDNSSVYTDQSHPSSTWNSNYVGVWHFSSPNGTSLDMNDSTVEGNNLSTTGSPVPTATSTIIDGGVNSVNYSDGYLTATSTSALPTGSSNMSICAWMNPTNTEFGPFGVVWYGTDSGYDYVRLSADDGQVYYGSSGYAASSSTIPNGAWSYVCGETVTSGTQAEIYINGALDTGPSNLFGTQDVTTSTTFDIGHDAGGGYTWEGK